MWDQESLLSEQLNDLFRIVRQSDVTELEIAEGDVRLRLHRAVSGATSSLPPSVPEPPAEVEPERLLAEVRSPLVGTFYRAGTPGTQPLVSDGSSVGPATVVGIVEALNVLTEVEAGCEGMVVEVLAHDGQPVEYGQVLFRVDMSG